MIRAHWSGRRLVVAGLLLVFGLCVWRLGLNVMTLHEGADPFGTIGRFFGAAFTPAMADQSPNLPEELAESAGMKHRARKPSGGTRFERPPIRAGLVAVIGCPTSPRVTPRLAQTARTRNP